MDGRHVFFVSFDLIAWKPLQRYNKKAATRNR
jgi:hypothetical protein